VSDTIAQGLQQHSVRSRHAAAPVPLSSMPLKQVSVARSMLKMVQTMAMLHLLQRVRSACADQVQQLLCCDANNQKLFAIQS